jgi:hypothetical protein
MRHLAGAGDHSSADHGLPIRVARLRAFSRMAAGSGGSSQKRHHL